MEKEKLTLVEKFHNYNGRIFCVKNIDVEGFSYIKFKVVGYMIGNNNYLIGKLVGGLGVTHHFLEPRNNDFIVGHKEGNNYYYVNLRMIENKPSIKKVDSRTRAVKIDELKIDDFSF